MIKLYEKKIQRNKKGYLKNINDWNKEIALIIAKEENIIITKNHWKIILFIRNFYLNFNIIPSMRILNKEITKIMNKKEVSSIYLLDLFPEGPLIQGTKIAGLPQTTKCL